MLLTTANHFPVPVKALFLHPLHRTVPIAIHINESVPLRHLRRGRADAVDAAPRCKAEQLHAVLDRFSHLKYMIPQILDPVSIPDAAVLFDDILCAQTVLLNK